MNKFFIDRLRRIADRAWTADDIARMLRKAADTMENQQTNILALQKELHETKSELQRVIAELHEAKSEKCADKEGK